MDLQLTAKSRDRRSREFMPKMEMGAAVDASTAGRDFIAVRRDGHASLRMRQRDPNSSHGPDLSPQPARMKIKAMKTNSFDMARQQ